MLGLQCGLWGLWAVLCKRDFMSYICPDTLKKALLKIEWNWIMGGVIHLSRYLDITSNFRRHSILRVPKCTICVKFFDYYMILYSF